MDKKFCLLKASDGTRGQAGKKKIYEVTVHGTKVTMSWGMAEKESRQTKTEEFYSDSYARQYGAVKVQEKMDKGYELVYTV